MEGPALRDAERTRLLERARERCFFLDLDDAGARLCRANMPYGIAKIHWMQRQLGHEPDASYISTPDSTVTRNIDRWASGFGYGGAIEWSGEFFPLELKPNCCGMLVAGLDELPDPDEAERAIARLSETTIEVGLVQAHWDMHRGNHFLNIYAVSDPDVTSGHPYVAIMHSSGSELRGPNPHGPGLYLAGRSSESSLGDRIEVMRTPFGPAFLLKGEAAEIYTQYAARVERFARKRRTAYARILFGEDVPILFNETHQGLNRPGRMLLGCYSGRDLPWVPVTLRPDLPAYLIAPGLIYSQEALDREGLVERARATGCLDRLLGAGLLPHGGGYSYPGMDGLDVEVQERGRGGRRCFRLGKNEWFRDVRGLPFSYRGEEVIRRIEEFGSGRVAAHLELVKRLEG
ncbi:MAG: hypothetical protein JRG91_14095 [Deltaproteobacteria bacterium]|nr:hypothetical protein [Deltaproteobacteria bacterium]